MAKKTAAPVPVEAQNVATLDMIASAQAPFLYFEHASAFGVLNGVIRVTLDAGRLLAPGTGSLHMDRVVVAHLRMSIPAALELRSALNDALLLANPTQTEAKN